MATPESQWKYCRYMVNATESETVSDRSEDNTQSNKLGFVFDGLGECAKAKPLHLKMNVQFYILSIYI